MGLRKKKKDLSEKKDEIQELGLNAISDYFKISRDELDGVNPNTLKHLHQRARLGMQFEREMNISNRAVELNYIRIFRLIAEDKRELKKLIKQSLPQYYHH